MPTLNEIAGHLFLSVTRIKQLQADGRLPREGTLDEFREAEFQRLRAQKAGTAKNDQKDRVFRSRADLNELQLAKLRGKLLVREDVIDTWSTKFSAMRMRLRGISKRLVVQVPGFTRPMALAVLEEIDEALTEISAGDGAPSKGRRQGVVGGGARARSASASAAE